MIVSATLTKLQDYVGEKYPVTASGKAFAKTPKWLYKENFETMNI